MGRQLREIVSFSDQADEMRCLLIGAGSDRRNNAAE